MRERWTPTYDFGLSPERQDVPRSPGTDLITGEGLSAVEITIESFIRSGPFVHFGCADVDACFHSLRFRGKICEYFCCEPMEAKWLVYAEIQGAPVPSSRLVCSTQISLPMGFSSATYFAQSVSCKLLDESLPSLRCQPLTDRSYQKVFPCRRNTAIQYAYIDTLGTPSCDWVTEKEAVARARDRFQSKAVKLHPLDVRSDVASTSGMNLNLTNFSTENTAICRVRPEST